MGSDLLDELALELHRANAFDQADIFGLGADLDQCHRVTVLLHVAMRVLQ
jgi:hypothetical protein